METNAEMLARLRDGGAAAPWEAFFQQYWQPILRYGRKLGLSREEAEDVLQETMVDLVRILPKFTYDPRRRFRNFVFTIVHRKCLRLFELRKRESRALEDFGKEAANAPGSGTSPGDPSEREALWDLSVIEALLDEMWKSGEITGQTRDIFRAYALKRDPSAVVAERFGVSENMVYQVKNRTQRGLRKRAQALCERIGEAESPLFV